jgi:hypothetical protein
MQAKHYVPRLSDSVNDLTKLYDSKFLDEKAFNDLLKLVISAYVANQVSSAVTGKLDTLFSRKLSPDHLLEPLA